MLATVVNWPLAPPVVPVAFSLLCVIGLARARLKLSGTTLMSAYWWSVVAAAVMLDAEVLAWISPRSMDHYVAREAAAILTLCPIMALLGAKRPQHRAWQWVVIAFWIILALPAIELLALRPGERLTLDWPRTLMVLVLVAIELFVYLPTRFWISILLLSAGQLFLLADYMPFEWPDVSVGRPIGLVCVAMSTLGWPWRSIGIATGPSRWDRVWQDFSDSFGTLWALRVRERVNAIAAEQGWPVRLGWYGFQADSAEPQQAKSTAETEAASQTLRMLLLRFVSPQWIDKRLQG